MSGPVQKAGADERILSFAGSMPVQAVFNLYSICVDCVRAKRDWLLRLAERGAVVPTVVLIIPNYSLTCFRCPAN